MYIRLNSVQIQYARIASYVSVCVQFLLFLAQIRAKIHLCFCKRLLWGIISQNLLLKREEIVIVYFREVRGINLKIVSLTFPWLFQGQKVHLRLKSRVDSCATTGWRYWPKSLDFFCLVRPFQLVIWKLKKNPISFAGPLAHIFPKWFTKVYYSRLSTLYHEGILKA